jgi:3'-5' exonuclease/Ankyrin repeats (3 copies)
MEAKESFPCLPVDARLMPLERIRSLWTRTKPLVLFCAFVIMPAAMALSAPLTANERLVRSTSSASTSTAEAGGEQRGNNAFTATATPTTRATAAQVRRAAGSQSLDKLKDSLAGWTRDELNGMASEDGKGAVHMAAWQGCLDNLQHLLDRVGCGVNAVATGQYSYGKTPIFFAATRSRDDVVLFLLNRGAHVKIVNNKGQSVLSIASSHLLPEAVQRVVQAEAEQEPLPWVNYRRTHSDGLEYGDLDPRFLDRPLRPHEDVVTMHAVNPTTKHSRRGSFLRRNPQLHPPSVSHCRESDSPTTSKRRGTNQRSTVETLSNDETKELHAAWMVLETPHSVSGASGKALLTILRLQCRIRQPWIKEVAARLSRTVPNPDSIEYVLAAVGRELAVSGDGSARFRALLDRLASHVRHRTAAAAAAESTEGHGSTVSQASRRRKNHSTLPSNSPVWKDAREHVSELSLRVFMLPPPQDSESYSLRLSEPPVWVDSRMALEKLRDRLASEPLVAFDTEWTSTGHDDGSTTVSTLQLAVDCKSAWIIDLENWDRGELEEAAHRSFQAMCRHFVQSLFEAKIMLGFALGRDIAKLEEWLGGSLDLTRCLDLQHYFSHSKHIVPGLASCARQVAVNMTDDPPETSMCLSPLLFYLDKSQQCSDWSQRPLTPSQLSYAALDAAILPYLLAEQARIKCLAEPVQLIQ